MLSFISASPVLCTKQVFDNMCLTHYLKFMRNLIAIKSIRNKVVGETLFNKTEPILKARLLFVRIKVHLKFYYLCLSDGGFGGLGEGISCRYTNNVKVYNSSILLNLLFITYILSIFSWMPALLL